MKHAIISKLQWTIINGAKYFADYFFYYVLDTWWLFTKLTTFLDWILIGHPPLSLIECSLATLHFNAGPGACKKQITILIPVQIYFCNFYTSFNNNDIMIQE